MTHGKRNTDHAAEAGADEGDRLRASAAFNPRREEIGETRHRQRGRGRGGVETAPRRTISRPTRTEHGVPCRVDQVGRTQRWPPRVTAAIGFHATVAKREWRGGSTRPAPPPRGGRPPRD